MKVTPVNEAPRLYRMVESFANRNRLLSAKQVSQYTARDEHSRVVSCHWVEYVEAWGPPICTYS